VDNNVTATNLPGSWVLEVKEYRGMNVVVVLETKLISNTNLRSPSAVARHKGSGSHLSLSRIVILIRYIIILG
jgi:hypothetical protein